jgi:DNA-binding NarL/FixJ family response regulator
LSEEKIQVVVADDRPLPRGFFELTIRSCEGYELAASFSAAGAAVSWCLEHPPQLVILDIMMSQGIDGLTAAARLKSAFPTLRIILATSMAEAKWLDEARKLGIEAFWYKDSDVPLPEVMDRVMAGETVYPDIPQLPIGRVSQTELSDRELDVLRELTACRTNQQIADSLCISVNTVRRHIQNMLDKTGFTDRLELAVHARELHIVVSDLDRRQGVEKEQL